jgi:hypothetical protein
MKLLVKNLEPTIRREKLIERNFMPSHHNESVSHPQYDRNDTNGYAKLSVRSFQNGNLGRNLNSQSNGQASVNVVTTLNPVWDRDRRELRYGGKVVKRFKWPAENQERILDSFEKHGWPSHIADPLDAHPKICPKRRLHDTLKCLNRKQLSGLVKFRGDGTGLGVLLEIVEKKD